MAIGIDTSKWKPRKIKGTPAATFRNLLGVGIITVGLACGVFFHQCVRSKYFVSKTAMDESLTDFQETKLNCKGPKAVQKAPKTKGRKVTKRIKGQKDIRTALKGKKNELISYSKEFDTVCKKSGLNVDSEELQLAIALSKSLQSDSPDDASTSQSTTTQSRISKIRTTLQEYGFKVPQTKITATNKRIKKHRKDYKLLNETEEEKRQKITSKYSQILFENLDCTKLVEGTCVSSDETPIYNIATNLEYECMRDNNIFYVNNLVERSITKGSLLRDWSEIPGRPVSPVLFDKNTMDFSEIICSQDELDIILSGPIKSANKIVGNKKGINVKQIECASPQVLIVDDNDESIEPPRLTVKEVDNSIIIEDNDKKTVEVKDTDLNNSLAVTEQYRSCSPDIFDDEESCMIETSRPLLSQGYKTKLFTEETNCMDLTDCVNKVEKTQFISQNITKIKPNDFMEITECAVSASQGIQEDINAIDLTQSSGEKLEFDDNDADDNLNYAAESPDSFIQKDTSDIVGHIEIDNDTIENAINLTQNSEEGNKSIISNENKCTDLQSEIVREDNLESKNVYECPKHNIDLTQSSNEDENRLTIAQGSNKSQHKETDLMDLTQSSKSSIDIDDLPEVNVRDTQDSQPNLDDTIILNEEEYIGTDGKLKKSIFVQDNQVFDLTQAADESVEQPDSDTKVRSSKIGSQSFYEDFIHDHSDSKENVDNIELCGDGDNAHNTSKESNEIDLTQSSDGSEINCGTVMPVTAIRNVPNNSSLGKKDDISIDYDEICDNEGTKDSNCLKADKDSLSLKYDSSKSQNYSEIVENNHDLVSNSSQNSEVFDLTDKELDYSMHKSRFDVSIDNHNFEFEVNDISNGGSPVKSIVLRNSITNKDFTLDEDYFPEVNVRKTEDKCIENIDNTNVISPNKIHDEGIKDRIPVVTPKNSEYIIKTDEVTPMLDYASMTTPQRNKELDKYGLKPFKRKRAIQILTHLYNQTHPMMESYPDDEPSEPSPSKKPRHDHPLHNSPKKLHVPGNPEEITRNTNSPQIAIPNSKSPSKAANIKKKLNSPCKDRIRNSKSPRKAVDINKMLNSPCKDRIRNSKSPKKANKISRNENSPRKVGNSSKECLLNAYELTSEMPNIKKVNCDPDDWVFQKREKAKVHSCRVPLHVAFHNYVSSRQFLREAILKYEPVNIDVIHKDLVFYGHRYDPKDLLRFLDKKCITVKTTDNNARNKR